MELQVFETPGWYKNYPTMITHEEMRMLGWLAKNSKKSGQIVDLGCFLGGSTVSLAWGNSMSNTSRKIYSFDRFEIDERLKHIFLYKKGHEFVEGTDAYPILKILRKKYSEYIVPRAGDVTKQNWDQGEISILFIDLSKSKAVNDYIANVFFPSFSKG